VVIWGWLATVVGGLVLLWGLGDRWWFGTLFLYGPRWPLLVPFPFLLLAAVLVRPRWMIPVLAGGLLVLGPILGFRTGLSGWGKAAGPATLRVVTFNMRGADNPVGPDVPAALIEYDPDVALIQECAPGLDAMPGAPSGWSFRRDGSLCAISRVPIDSATAADVIQTREDGMSGFAMLYQVRVDGGVVPVVNLHLETPRRGIEMVQAQGEASGLARNILVRDMGSRRLTRWIAASAPGAIVGGDFNLPPESVIYRRHWGHCRNAFSSRGRGFGYTRILPRWAARIDHVLACGPEWEIVAAQVGAGLGSDHLPLVVDLRRR